MYKYTYVDDVIFKISIDGFLLVSFEFMTKIGVRYLTIVNTNTFLVIFLLLATPKEHTTIFYSNT